jgi:hypothetical protein
MFVMQRIGIAIVLGLLCLGTAAQADTSATGADQLFGTCQQLNDRHSYEVSAAVCAAAADNYGQIAAKSGDWTPYLREAISLEFQANDEAMLAHHRLAYQKALHAHRLALYVYRYFPSLDPVGYNKILITAQHLASFEANQIAYIHRNIGD